MTIDGATDTAVFQADVRSILVPTQRPGDIVEMDTLGPDKNEATLALIAQAGTAVRFRPAYSPDLNPIAVMRSNAKTTCDQSKPDPPNNSFRPSPPLSRT